MSGGRFGMEIISRIERRRRCIHPVRNAVGFTWGYRGG